MRACTHVGKLPGRISSLCRHARDRNSWGDVATRSHQGRGQQVGPEKAGLGQAGGRMRPRQAPCLPFRPLRKVLLLKHKGTQQAPPSGGPRPSAWEAGAGASGQVCVRLPLGPTAPWALRPAEARPPTAPPPACGVVRRHWVHWRGTRSLPWPGPRAGSPYCGGALGLCAALMHQLPTPVPPHRCLWGWASGPLFPWGREGSPAPPRDASFLPHGDPGSAWKM